MAKFWPLHQLIVVEGTVLGGDVWSFSLRTMWGPTPGLQMSFADQETILKSFIDPPFYGVASIVNDYWTATDPALGMFPSAFTLDAVKFNSIGHDGKYFYPDTSEYLYSPVIPGPNSVGADPRQSIVITLRGDYSRGRGSYGRFFPPSQAPGYSSGNTRFSSDLQTACATRALTMINALNSIAIDENQLTVVNVSPGDDVTGTEAVITPVTAIEVDRITDTQRRRTNSLPGLRESYAVG
jgi:hypothetical protein